MTPVTHKLVPHLTPHRAMASAEQALLVVFLCALQTITRTLAPASAARTVVFSAPEILHNVGQVAGSRRSKEADVYAFGMILFELFTG